MLNFIVAAGFLISCALWTVTLGYEREMGEAGLLSYLMPVLTFVAGVVWLSVAFTT